jgi:serine/threonine protein kinase
VISSVEENLAGAPEGEFSETIRALAGEKQRFRRYTLMRLLGRGGMGVVWLAKDRTLDRDVALKFLPEISCLDASALDDLRTETKKSLELTHPNIVRIYDFVEEGDAAAISMEYIDGPTLSSLRVTKTSRVFEVSEIEQWVHHLCVAMEYAHTVARVVHRDLKPANLMINSKGHLKITDFGIACSVMNTVSRLTRQTSSTGTPAYMSPQQLEGRPASASDDIYAIGATIYELLTGKPPFYSGDIGYQIRSMTPDSMRTRRKEMGLRGVQIPENWEKTVAACLEKNPAKRPDSSRELWRQLRARPAVRFPSMPSIKGITLEGWKRHLISPAAAIGAALVCGISTYGFLKSNLLTGKDPAAPAPQEKHLAKTIALPVSAPDVQASVATIKTPEFAGDADYLTPPAKTETTFAAPLLLKTIPDGISYMVVLTDASGNTGETGGTIRRGETPATLDSLPEGKYTILFRRDGWADYVTDATLSSDKLSTIEHEFSEGTLIVKSNPDDVDVYIDDEWKGRTPLILKVAPGNQNLSLQFDDDTFRKRTAVVTKGKETTVLVELHGTVKSHRRPKQTPNPLQKLGNSIKSLFH